MHAWLSKALVHESMCDMTLGSAQKASWVIEVVTPATSFNVERGHVESSPLPDDMNANVHACDKQPSKGALAITTEDLNEVEGLHAPIKARVPQHQEHLRGSMQRTGSKTDRGRAVATKTCKACMNTPMN